MIVTPDAPEHIKLYVEVRVSQCLILASGLRSLMLHPCVLSTSIRYFQLMISYKHPDDRSYFHLITDDWQARQQGVNLELGYP